MTKKTIKMNEAQLRKMIAESVKKVLKEMDGNEWADDEIRQQETNFKDQQARSEGKAPYYFVSDTYQNDGSFIKIWLKPEQLVNGKYDGKTAYSQQEMWHFGSGGYVKKTIY